MKQVPLENEYGSVFGQELTFDTYAEMREYEKEHYGEDGFPNDDNWNYQIRVKVLEELDPESLAAILLASGMSKEELRKKGFFIK